MKAPDPKRESTVAAAALAKMLGLTPRRLGQLVDEGIIPPTTSHGRYLLAPCVLGYVTFLKSRALPNDPGSNAFLDQRTRLTMARADRENIELMRLKGEVVAVEVAGQRIEECFALVRESLLSIPGKLAPRLVGKARPEIKRSLDLEINEALRGLHKRSEAA